MPTSPTRGSERVGPRGHARLTCAGPVITAAAGHHRHRRPTLGAETRPETRTPGRVPRVSRPDPSPADGWMASVPTQSCVKCLRGPGCHLPGRRDRGPVRRLGRARGPGGYLRERKPVPQSGRVSERRSQDWELMARQRYHDGPRAHVACVAAPRGLGPRARGACTARGANGAPRRELHYPEDTATTPRS